MKYIFIIAAIFFAGCNKNIVKPENNCTCYIISQRFNVLSYTADATGVYNTTVAMQNALNADAVLYTTVMTVKKLKHGINIFSVIDNTTDGSLALYDTTITNKIKLLIICPNKQTYRQTALLKQTATI
jgi:hypothetical protein